METKKLRQFTKPSIVAEAIINPYIMVHYRPPIEVLNMVTVENRYQYNLLNDLNELLEYNTKKYFDYPDEIQIEYIDNINSLTDIYYKPCFGLVTMEDKYFWFMRNLGFAVTSKIILFELMYNIDIKIEDIGENNINFYNSKLINLILSDTKKYDENLLKELKKSIKKYKISLFNLKDRKTKRNLLKLIDNKITNK